MKIFVTVGTQLPFDRLIKIIDQLPSPLKSNLFAQVGPSKLRSRSFKHKAFLDPLEYQKRLEECDLVISHAGVGTIISTLNLEKPIILVPRDSRFGEHRNQHQFSTSERFSALEGCYIANSKSEILQIINNLSNGVTPQLSASNEQLSENLFAEVALLLINS